MVTKIARMMKWGFPQVVVAAAVVVVVVAIKQGYF